MSEQPVQTSRGMPVAEAACATDLVSYQPGSVVSRQLIKHDKGNVTLFAFDQAQGLSEHTAPFDALVHVLEGEAEVTISGKPLRAKAGELVLMPAHQPHSLSAVTRFKMLLTMVRSGLHKLH
ncbi:MAG: cupin domain-containing protein [Acidobacteria bacterium]|nr:cupin domain-containing protein [Acidobacteriota bacterium]